MAPYILPVIENRPLVMKRFPNGIDGKSFYQHRAPDRLPDELRVTIVREKPDRPDSGVPYLIGGQLQTLLYMAQLAVISQDPWFSQLSSIEAIDQVALDLDPMPGATFNQVLDVACWLHDELVRLGIPAFPKTSGSEGIHIFIPLPPDTPYEAGMIFCQVLATVVATRHPETATVERMVKKRRKVSTPGENCSFVAPEHCTHSDSDEVTSLRSSSPPSAGDGSVWTPSRRVRGD